MMPMVVKVPPAGGAVEAGKWTGCDEAGRTDDGADAGNEVVPAPALAGDDDGHGREVVGELGLGDVELLVAARREGEHLDGEEVGCLERTA